MRTLGDLLREGRVLSPRDVGEVMARAAGLLRYGHEQGAVHGDVTPETLLVEPRDGGWEVQLDQPRPGVRTGAGPADDVLGLGLVLLALAQDLPRDRLPELFPAALSSMTDPDPGRRPRPGQVEHYFAEDFPATLPEGARATLPEDSRATFVEADRDEGLIPFTQAAVPADQPRGRSAALAVSVLVLALGLGAVGLVLWQTLGADDEPPVAVSDTRPTDEEGAEEPSTDPDPDQVSATTDEPAAPATITQEETAAGTQTGSSASATTAVSRPDVPVPTAPTGSAPSPPPAPVAAADHTAPDWEGHGWDVRALDDAYCRDGSSFIGLADTQTYRGVICGHATGYSYRGLNKAGNATLHSYAEPDGSGWQATGEGGVRYSFDEDGFVIYDADGTVLDEERVTTWLTPQDRPFRPGDLDLSQPITYPDCDGSGVVVLASWRGGGDVAELVQDSLDEHPGSYYIRTDLACDNFNRPDPDLSGMEYIYSIMRPAGVDHDEVCAQIEQAGTYGYWLQEGVDPGIHIDCD